MILADAGDVAARLRRPLDDSELLIVDGLLEEASVLVSEHCRGRDFTTGVPDAVRITTSRVAARAISAPQDTTGVASFTNQAGPFQQVRTFTGDASNGGIYLTSVDRKMLRRWAKGVVSSVPTS